LTPILGEGISSRISQVLQHKLLERFHCAHQIIPMVFLLRIFSGVGPPSTLFRRKGTFIGSKGPARTINIDGLGGCWNGAAKYA
jgi:hypothetical protein